MTGGNKTLTIIKPDAIKNGHTGEILDKIIKAGFHISAMKFIHLTTDNAKSFYVIHKDRPFFNELVKFMSSGPIIVAILEKNNAVEEFRKLIGVTDPSKALPGTIRNLYGTSVRTNAVHGSDSDDNAEIECSFFFSAMEK